MHHCNHTWNVHTITSTRDKSKRSDTISPSSAAHSHLLLLFHTHIRPKMGRCRYSVFTPYCSSWGRHERGEGSERSGPRRRTHLYSFGHDSLRKMLLSAPQAIWKNRRCDLSWTCRHPIAIAVTDEKVVATSSSRAAHVLEPMFPAATRTKCANDALPQTMSNGSRRGCASLKLGIGLCSTSLPG